MTVRWKPLLILSGLFLVVALVGVVAITVAMMPRSAEGILKVARAARAAGRFENAVIYYKQALQVDPRNASIHEDFAGLYRDWARRAPEDQRAALHGEWQGHLFSAVKFDKAAKGPRRELLRDAMDQDLALDSVYWAKELLNAAPDDPDAHYVLAAEALEERAPNVAEIKRHLEALEKVKAPAVRRIYLRARLADLVGDEKGRLAALAEARTQEQAQAPNSVQDAVDLFARLRLTALEIRFEAGWQQLAGPVGRLREQVKALGKPEELPPARVARLRALLESTQKSLTDRSAKLPPDGKTSVAALVDAIEVDLETVFRQALADGRQPDLQTFLAYADHLRLRRQPDRCLEVVDRALKAPQASQRTAMHQVMLLHLVAVDMILSKTEDTARFDKAASHVQAMLDSTEPRYQAFGHLFAGSIDLDKSGLAREMSGSEDGPTGRQAVPKLRSSALNHLKLAAAGLPDIAEAQAKYGVALVLAKEQNLGRQYLQNALRLGSLEPQYQLWAAWTILQAGYPEEAEPIVQSMLRQVERGGLPRDMEGTLHLLQGELYQARRSPDDLKKAVEEFDRAQHAGQAVTPTAVMRLAQIDVQLGQYDRALARLNAVRSQGKGGAAAEQLTILTLEDKGEKAQARALLQEARGHYPKSAELAGLEAALLVKDGKAAEADAALERFLRAEPENHNLVMMRAQIQAENLKAPDRARALLESIAERSDTSAPMVQLAVLELDRGRLEEAAAVVARIRARWKDSATVDVLDAQLALKRGKVNEAIEHFNTALRKDPDNKVVQYWKAKLDGSSGSVAEAARALEDIVRDKPVKEVEAGTTLMSAAQSALAGLSLQARDFDEAIRRFEELKRNSGTGTLSRGDRWKLITAYINKGQWGQAKREIASILNDAKSPPSFDERVRGANFYRQQGENAAALAQIDYVLKVEPTHPAAVVTRSYILLEEKQLDRAAAILRTAIEQTAKDGKTKPPAVFYLVLAAVENESPPATDALTRALKVLDDGLLLHPQAPEIVQARYLALAAADRGKEALAFIEAKAKEDPKGPFRRVLVEKLREQKQYDRAAQLLAELHKEFPTKSNLAAALVQVVSLQAAEAGARGQSDRQRQLEDRATAMIREYRELYRDNAAILQTECDLAARRGDFTGAIALTREIDKVAKGSALGPVLRVRLFTTLNRPDEVARAFGEAIDRERGVRQLDYRVLLGQVRLKMGDADEALHQAGLVLDLDKKRLDAQLLQARALAESGATPGEKAARRRDSLARLHELIKGNPKLREAYQAVVEIHLKAGERTPAIAALRDNLRVIPEDAGAAGQLVQLLSQRLPNGQAPPEADMAEARHIAGDLAGRDEKGVMMLALAAGFQRAGQLELALPLAQRAAAKLDSPAAHRALGDILLAVAEGQPTTDAGRKAFVESVAEYDRVIKAVPDSVEAVNNKAWILHTYLDKSREALEIALALQKRAAPVALPCEFYDTLGAIQESVGKSRDAEASYLEGLKKDPRNPALNYHFARLLAADPARATKAKSYLAKALTDRGRLSPTMAREADQLGERLNGSIRGN
jgi:tetratricopeptide (TPR) repeat protein